MQTHIQRRQTNSQTLMHLDRQWCRRRKGQTLVWSSFFMSPSTPLFLVLHARTHNTQTNTHRRVLVFSHAHTRRHTHTHTHTDSSTSLSLPPIHLPILCLPTAARRRPGVRLQGRRARVCFAAGRPAAQQPLARLLPGGFGREDGRVGGWWVGGCLSASVPQCLSAWRRLGHGGSAELARAQQAARGAPHRWLRAPAGRGGRPLMQTGPGRHGARAAGGRRRGLERGHGLRGGLAWEGQRERGLRGR